MQGTFLGYILKLFVVFLGHKHKVKRQTNSYENYLASTPRYSSATGGNDQYDNYATSQSSSAGSDGVDESQPGEFLFISRF